MKYLITWTVELDADSVEEAVREALGMHRDPSSEATVFRVEDVSTGRSDLYDVDTDGSVFLFNREKLEG